MTLAFWSTRCQRGTATACDLGVEILLVRAPRLKFDFRRFNGESRDESTRSTPFQRRNAVLRVSTHNAAATVAARIGDEGVGRRRAPGTCGDAIAESGAIDDCVFGCIL